MSKDEKKKINNAPTYEELLKNPKLVQELLKREYKVGYRHPPKGTQFKPGLSGNPKGRPKGKNKSLRDTLEKTLAKTVSVRKGDRVRKVDSLEAIFMMVCNKALKGDQRSIESIYKMAKDLGLFNNQTQRVVIDEDLSHFTTEELVEFRRLCKKANARAIPV